jgi:hypothetical protein
MTYDRCLKRLDERIPEYIKNVGNFQYETETYTLTDYYISDLHEQCEICGHFPIREIYVVTNTKGETFIVGNVCINTISNQKISRWYKEYRRRRETLQKNKHVLDAIDKFPDKWNYEIQKKLNPIETRICKGHNPTKKQREYLKCLLNTSV